MQGSSCRGGARWRGEVPIDLERKLGLDGARGAHGRRILGRWVSGSGHSARSSGLLRGDYFELCVNSRLCGNITSLGSPLQAPRPISDAPAPDPFAWRRAAQAGDAHAQFCLGDSHFEGRGVGRNHRAAAHFYRRAAEQGVPLAWLRLAFMYEHGLGIEQDDFIALRWCRRAAEYGFLSAMLNLGDRYAEGTNGAAGQRAGAQVVQSRRFRRRCFRGSAAGIAPSVAASAAPQR